MNCPVCGALMVEDYRDTIEGNLCEYADHCPNGCVQSDYAYGAYRERIGEQEWVWTWQDSLEAGQQRRREQAAAIQALRQARGA